MDTEKEQNTMTILSYTEVLGYGEDVARVYDEVTAAHDGESSNCECGNCWAVSTATGTVLLYQADVRRFSAKYPEVCVCFVCPGDGVTYYFVNGALLWEEMYSPEGSDFDLALRLLDEVKGYLGNSQPAITAQVG